MLGNVVASGTAIIDELGAEHVRTGRPIVYTSADSVFQIAAHEDVVPMPQLYEWCEIAYELPSRAWDLAASSRALSSAQPGAFKRTANRHDYAMPPRGETLLDRLQAAGDSHGRDRQDQRSLRRARHQRRRTRRRATTTA